MKYIREVTAGVFVELLPTEALFVTVLGQPDIQHPPQTWLAWTVDEQIALSVYQVAAYVPAAGKTITGDPSYSRTGTVVTETYSVVDSVPFITMPVMVAAAINVNIVGGDITLIEGAYNIAASLYVDVGVYMFFFCEAQPDTTYLTICSGVGNASATTEATDAVTVEVVGDDGTTHFDPIEISVQVFRITPL